MTIIIQSILETEKTIKLLVKYWLVEQYKKIKEQLLLWNINLSNRLKLRQPKQDGVWYFRINQQYRALARYTKNELHVFDIDTHQ